MNCKACKLDLLPENPTVPQWDRWTDKDGYIRIGKRHPPICETCPSPFKEIVPMGWGGVRGGEGSIYNSVNALMLDVEILRTAIADKKVLVKREYIQAVPRPKGKYHH